MNRMITGHHHLASGKTDHSLVGQEDLFKHLLLFSLSSTAVSEIMLGACAHALCEVSLLKSLCKSDSHSGRQICVFSI